MDVVDQARHERAQDGKQGQQLGVVGVDHEGAQAVQRRERCRARSSSAASAAGRQRGEAHAVAVAAGSGAGHEIGHVVARGGQGAAFALVDAGVVGTVHHRQVDHPEGAVTRRRGPGRSRGQDLLVDRELARGVARPGEVGDRGAARRGKARRGRGLVEQPRERRATAAASPGATSRPLWPSVTKSSGPSPRQAFTAVPCTSASA